MQSRTKPKESTSKRKVTPPSPSYMSNDQFGEPPSLPRRAAFVMC